MSIDHVKSLIYFWKEIHMVRQENPNIPEETQQIDPEQSQWTALEEPRQTEHEDTQEPTLEVTDETEVNESDQPTDTEES